MLKGNRLGLKALLVVALGALGVTSNPKPAAAASAECGQCVDAYICLFTGEWFCQQSCGKPFAGCVSGVPHGCNTDNTNQIVWVQCGDES